MSDEEDAEVDGIAVWLVKPPSFRAPALTDLCNALQTRLDEDPKYRASHTPRRKEEGVFSTRDPPTKYDPEKASRHLAGAPPADARPPRRRTSTPMSDITNCNPTTTPAPPSRPNPATSVRSLSFQDSMAMEGFNEAREVQQNELDSFDMFEDSMLTEL
ncbi:uncharacterized protein LOC118431306 [Branchiostoma floridae]|uniref:Uncharacterized protein LOC118431306 n=1 Tax=Branchiostoma floridae TaxID=7739 RepID=A0A9J7MCY3_BRAFL|nr:uncharacterized protein LOC118431306 [Branchiostoma floridae]